MKELSIKEKAKLYDEAKRRGLDYIRLTPATELVTRQSILEHIFPELKESESEDERIRKELIDYLKERKSCESYGQYVVRYDRWIAWLEKQGEQKEIDYNEELEKCKANPLYFFDKYVKVKFKEQKPTIEMKSAEESLGIDSETYNKIVDECIYGEQKPADKVEPKFHEGDWVVSPNGVYWHIDAIQNGRYEVTADTGQCGNWPLDTNLYRLWTIQDAKDGDLIYVSTEEKGIQAIFHEYKNGTIFFHCYLCSDFVQGDYMPIGSVKLVYPLQKVHYKKFFEKMHEAGYEWDADKKELKKIEQKSIESSREELDELEKASTKYAQDKYMPVQTSQAFKAGANWQKEQFEKNRLAACDKQTEEEAEIEQSFLMGIIECEHRQPTFDDAIKYGMRLHKEQMMKDATEATVHIEAGNYPYIPQMELYDYDKDIPLAKEGDKYKVILIKEDLICR